MDCGYVCCSGNEAPPLPAHASAANGSLSVFVVWTRLPTFECTSLPVNTGIPSMSLIRSNGDGENWREPSRDASIRWIPRRTTGWRPSIYDVLVQSMIFASSSLLCLTVLRSTRADAAFKAFSLVRIVNIVHCFDLNEDTRELFYTWHFDFSASCLMIVGYSPSYRRSWCEISKRCI